MSYPCEEHHLELQKAVDDLRVRFDEKVKGKSAAIERELSDITRDLPDTEGLDARVDIEFDVDWKEQRIKLHLPEVTMNLQTWIFHLPSVTMKDKRIVFHTPSVRMVPRKIGQYPEIHGFTIKWKDIITHVPETFMEKHEIVMGIPEIRMVENQTKLHIPELTMKLTEIILSLPEFRIRRISVESERISAEAQAIADRFKDEIDGDRKGLVEGARSTLVPLVNGLFTCMRTQIENSKAQTVAQFETPIASLRSAIEKTKNVGAADQVPALEAQLNDLLRARQQTLARFEEAVSDLMTKERTTVEKLVHELG